jgi:hypothetical protein
MWTSAAALLAAFLGAAVDSGEPALSRPLVQPDSSHLRVSFDLSAGFDDAVRERIASGLATTFDYEIELRRDRKRWFDAGVASAEVQLTAMYNALTREYLVNVKVDGRLIESRSVRDEAALEVAMTHLERIPVFPLAEVPRGVRMLVRARAFLGARTWLGIIPSRQGTGWRESGKFRVPAPSAAAN